MFALKKTSEFLCHHLSRNRRLELKKSMRSLWKHTLKHWQVSIGFALLGYVDTASLSAFKDSLSVPSWLCLSAAFLLSTASLATAICCACVKGQRYDLAAFTGMATSLLVGVTSMLLLPEATLELATNP